jgi:glycosyltransferase involved in cell wall biosynthesis
VTPSKRLDVALRAFRRVRERLPTSRYLVVGEMPAQHDLRPLVAELGLADAVAFTGYVEKPDLLAFVAAADVGINLRWPVLGETSGSLLRLLAAGKATIVTDAGPFAEFPDDCCVKIPVGPDEGDRLVATMLRLGQDAPAREDLGRAARQHVEEHHRIEDSARKYAEFLEAVLG